MTALTLTNVCKSFGKVEVLKDIDLDGRGRRVRRLCRPLGLREVDAAAGDRRARGRELGHRRHRRAGGRRGTARPRGIAMVFQTYALYPHLTVRGNMALGLKQAGVPKALIEAAGDEGEPDAVT
jgi:multiple sugar transport system ATP-binding protein